MQEELEGLEIQMQRRKKEILQRQTIEVEAQRKSQKGEVLEVEAALRSLASGRGATGASTEASAEGAPGREADGEETLQRLCDRFKAKEEELADKEKELEEMREEVENADSNVKYYMVQNDEMKYTMNRATEVIRQVRQLLPLMGTPRCGVPLDPLAVSSECNCQLVPAPAAELGASSL